MDLILSTESNTMAAHCGLLSVVEVIVTVYVTVSFFVTVVMVRSSFFTKPSSFILAKHGFCTIGAEEVVVASTEPVVVPSVDEAVVGADVVPGTGASLTVVPADVALVIEVVPAEVVVATVVVSASGKHATKEMTLPSGTGT
jgi:hypothetical protein